MAMEGDCWRTDSYHILPAGRLAPDARKLYEKVPLDAEMEEEIERVMAEVEKRQEIKK